MDRKGEIPSWQTSDGSVDGSVSGMADGWETSECGGLLSPSGQGRELVVEQPAPANVHEHARCQNLRPAESRLSRIAEELEGVAYDVLLSPANAQRRSPAKRSGTIKSKEEVLREADFITLHVPAQKEYVIGKAELELMKDGSALINAARGGVVDEIALIDALDSGKLAFAGLDVFESEPKPEIRILMHPKITLSPHIGAATNEAQDRIGTELAEQIQAILK